MSNILEEWLPVVGYEGMYSVSSEGRVRSEPRQHISKIGRSFRVRERFLRPYQNKDGYLQVVLCNGTKKVCVFIHALVLAAFVGPRPDGCQACHNRGDPSNNRVANLRWDSPRSNSQDRILHGTDSRGAKNWNAKLNAEQVLDIRRDPRTIRAIATSYGVTPATISAVRARKTWVFLGEQW